MALRPLNDNIIIEPDPLEYTDSNPEVVKILKDKNRKIEIPEKYEGWFKKVAPTGTIVSWGDRCQYSHVIGEKVWFRHFSGRKLRFEDKDYLVINEWDLIGKDENGNDS